MVRVEPVTRAWAEVLAEGDEAFRQRFGVPVEPGWSAFPETIPFLLAVTREGETATWGPHLFFDDLDGALVGNGGWKGPPEAGTVELGYAVAPTRQGRGLATAAVRELLQRAQRAQVQRVLAHTLPRRSSSTTVLERCGFTQVGEEIDPEDGPVWRWELTLPVDP
jgi:[ribosomal protein S5]-alanine N-acetyltransferase